MKKSLFYSTAVMVTMGLASCNSEETIDLGGHSNGGDQVIELAVANAGSGASTRAGRPLNSSEAKQTIENVKIIVCNDKNQVVADTLITDWMKSENVINYNDASGHGRKVRFSMGGVKLSAGQYYVYAFGYHKGSQYKVDETALEQHLEGIKHSSSTFAPNLVITNSKTSAAEEIFAGSASIVVDATGKFTQGITLHRQPAGIFSYVYNIPYYKGGTTLELWAAKNSSEMMLGNFYSGKLGNNGTDNAVEAVVNGINSKKEKTLVYKVNLNDFFKELKDVNNDGFIDRAEYKNVGGVLVEGDLTNKDELLWQKPERFNSVALVKGSVFGGEFIIPFTAASYDCTFVLALTDDKGTTFRTWNINLPESDVLKGENLGYWTGIQWFSAPTTESKTSYSVLRNHLYGIGRKDVERPDGTDPSKPTDPTDPTNPDKPTEPENPQDLNTKQDIMLQVNDNWEIIHKMEVE